MYIYVYFFQKNTLDMFNTVISLEKSLDPYLDTKKITNNSYVSIVF